MSRMPGPAPATARAPSWPLVAVVALLIAANLQNNLLAPDRYLLWTSLGVIGLALLAKADGLHPPQWGLGRVQRRSAVAAVSLATATAGVMLLGTQLPGLASAFVDERAAALSGDQVAFAASVRAPFGTALFEEVAFRGVLLAMLARRFGSAWAIAGSSVAFGLWHILPALSLATGNVALGSVLEGRPLTAVTAAFVSAGIAGAALCLVRIRYDHLVVPLAVHATATSLGYLLAWLATR